MTAPAPDVAAASFVVRIGTALDPATLAIRPGDVVTWRNEDAQRHRMRSTSGPAEFDSGNLEPGESFSFTFTDPGTYRYRDERDPDLSNYWGTITVTTATPPPGASAPPPPPGATPPPAGVTVTMAGRVFRPASVTIAAGGRVTWRNDDDRDHTVTARDASFDSGLMGTGATFVRTFTTPGTFAYLCLLHPDMTGTVTVTPAPGATPPPPTPTPPPPTPTPVPPPPGPSDVTALDFAFSPATIDVVVGTRVRWANRGAALHTVTAQDGSFDSGLMGPGASFSRVFASPGTFPYLCVLHPGMTGVVRVAASPGATAPPPVPTTPPTPRPTAPPGAVRMLDFAFAPATLRVDAGSVVTWVNDGVAPHTVTARSGAFDSRIVSPGGRYAHVFTVPGTYMYLCSLHPDMTGTILVASADGSVPPPGAVPAAPSGGGGADPDASAPPGTADALMLDFSFDPVVLTVTAGTTVRWRNAGVAIHTVTAGDGSFDSGFVDAGETYARTFDAPRTIDYICALHPQMIGTLVVVAAGEQAPIPSPGSGGPAPVPGGAGGSAGAGGGGSGDRGGDADRRGAAIPGGAVDAGRLAIVLAIVLVAFAVAGRLLRDTMRSGETGAG